MKKTSLFLGILFSLFSIALVSAQTGGSFSNCPMGGMMYGSYGAGVMAFSWIFGILTTVALILLIFWLIKQMQKK